MRWMLIQRTIFIEPNERVGFTYMKKGSNLRWSLIQCSGGDEGDRTPDLLTASQALSQLSYAPVRRSTIRELGPRCKDNFGKTFRGRGRRSPSMPDQARGARPAGLVGAAAARPSGSTPPAPGTPATKPAHLLRLADIPDHGVSGKNKTAGRRPAVFAK